MYIYNVWTQLFSALFFRSVLAIILLFIHTALAHAQVNQKGTYPAIHTVTSSNSRGTLSPGIITCVGNSDNAAYECAAKIIQFNANGGNGILTLVNAAPGSSPYHWDTQFIYESDPENVRDGYFSLRVEHSCLEGDKGVYDYQTNYRYCEQRSNDNSCPVGNPVSPFSGEKIERNIDFNREAVFPVVFERFYHSKTPSISQQVESVYDSIGDHWDHRYSSALTGMLTEHLGYTWQSIGGVPVTIDQHIYDHYNAAPEKFLQTLTLHQPNGDKFYFTNTYNPESKCFVSPEWESLSSRSIGSLSMTDACDLSSEYTFSDRNNISSIFNNSGRLIRMESSSGVSHNLVYEQEKLSELRHSLGGSFVFEYNQDRVSAITDTATNEAWSYRYDALGNLKYVDYPDSTTLEYHYEDQSIPYALTGITDRRGIRYSHYFYDSRARVEAEYHGTQTEVTTDRIEGIEIRYDLSFGNVTELTTSRGYTTKYTKTTVNGNPLPSRVDGPGCLNCGQTGFIRDYYEESFDLRSIDDNGLKMEYVDYGLDGNPGTIIEAVDSIPDVSRTKVYTYDSLFIDKIATVNEPSVYTGGNKETTKTYDNFGNTTSITVNGYRPDGTPVSKSQSFKYNGPYHQLSEINGPRTDVDDISIIKYYADNAAEGNNRARMKKVTAPLGIVLYDNITYTPTGNMGSYTTGANMQADFTYYLGNDRLETQTLTDLSTGNARITRWTYVSTGEVESITQGYATSEATTLTLEYDDARRLKRVYDSLNNYIEYMLDTEGNVIDENIYDQGGILLKTLNQSFDAYNRLDISAQENETRDYNFSPDGTLDLETDGKSTVTDYSYDDLRRLTSITQDLGGADPSSANALTQFDYDDQDNLVSVTDSNGGLTSYVYDDLGNLLSLTSPDTGASSYTHDEAGNIVTMIDAKGQEFSYSYDVLGRITLADAPGTLDDATYIYDSCENGAGKLCSVTRDVVTVSYGYTAFGDIKFSSQSVETFPSFEQAVAQMSYSYDAVGRIRDMVYPSGNKVTYTYDAAGNVYSVILNDGENNLVTDSQYHPFGPERLITRGNGSTRFGYLDQAYRTFITGNGGYFYDVIYYDENGNPETFYSSEGNKVHAYDALERLDNSSGPYGSRDYGYDINDNRTSKQVDSVTDNYSYNTNSNRMTTNAGSAVVLDPNGNTTSLYGMSINYTTDNRVSNISDTVFYYYNGLGERAMKALVAAGAAGTYGYTHKTVYIYGLSGKLLAEIGSSGKVKQEYIYMNDELLTTIVYKPNGGEPILNADMDGDGAIGVDDYLIWYFNHYNVGDISRDVNGDGLLDTNDINLVLNCALSGGAGAGCTTSSYSSSIYYAHSDHLGTPHMLSDESGVAVWSAVYDPFGKAIVNEDLDGDGKSVTLNIRFPGQYYDAESGLHYNYFRYYDPETGRYITSDPIGLAGGLNTFGYVGGAPLRRIDPLGLLYLDLGYSGSANGRYGPGITAGVQAGPDGLYIYYGFGLGAGAGASFTLNSGRPNTGVSVSATARGGRRVGGIPVGGYINGSFNENCGLGGSIGGGFGVGTGISLTATQTTKVIDSINEIVETINNFIN